MQTPSHLTALPSTRSCLPNLCTGRTKRKRESKAKSKTERIWHDETHKWLTKKNTQASVAKGDKRFRNFVQSKANGPLDQSNQTSAFFCSQMPSQTDPQNSVYVIDPSRKGVYNLIPLKATSLNRLIITLLAETERAAQERDCHIGKKIELPTHSSIAQPDEYLVDEFWQVALHDPIFPSSYLPDSEF